MVIVTGQFRVAPADRDAFIATKHEGIKRSRAEAGCISYVFAPDPIESDLVVLYERWESQAHLDTHIAAMRAPGAPTPPPGPAPTRAELLICDVSGVRPFG